MSVQLIVYPQSNPNGTYTYTQVANTTEYVGSYNFYWILFALNTGTTSSTPPVSAVQTEIPLIGTWKSWRTTGGTYSSVGAPTFQFTNSTCTLKSSASGNSSTGLYQLIDGLTVGQDYEITYKVKTGGGTGTVYIGSQYGSQIDIGGSGYNTCGASLFVDYSVSAGTYTGHVFTATDTTELLLFEYINNDGSNIVLNWISIKEVQTSANSIYEDVHDGQVILDLYDDTSIPLTLSVDNFKDAAEKPTSYSKAFKLPATKRNNQVFGSMFDVTISTDGSITSFNPYKKTSIRLKEDGYTIFDGLLKMIDISDTSGEISYNVNLYSNTVSLKETLSNKKLGEIDLSELEHDYNHTNIINSWTGVLDLTNTLSIDSFAGSGSTTGVLKYPLCDWTGNFTKYPNSGFSVYPLEEGFQPWIQCKYLLDRIFSEAGLNYESTFLNTTKFTKLFLDWNTGGGIHGGSLSVKQANDEDPGVAANDNWTAAYTGYTDLKFTYVANEIMKSEYWTVDDSTFTATRLSQEVIIHYGIKIRNSTGGDETIRFRLRQSVGGNVPGTFSQVTIPGNSTHTFSGTVTTIIDTNTTIKAQFVSQTNSADVVQYGDTSGNDYMNFYVQAETMNETDFSMSMRGEMSQWDFLNGFIKMFNLTIMQNPPNSGDYYIEPYVDVFQPWTDTNDVEILDWTDKVDAQEFKLSPINTLKKHHIFTYKKDSKDHVSTQYSDQLQGYLFGTYEREETQNDFVTGTEKIESIFSPTIDKFLFYTQFACPALYAKKGDDEFESYDNKPRVLYDNGVHLAQYNGYGFDSATQNGTSGFSNQQSYLRFSHWIDPVGSIGDLNYNFGACDFIGPGPHPVETLYSEYWSPYIDELYHSDTRVLKLKINLYPSDISTFRFFDNVRIKNRLYRVNKIDYKPGEMSNVELILL